MQRLDREPHAGGLALGAQGGDAVGDLLARFGERLTGDGAADEDDERCSEGMRLGDGLAIVVERLGATFGRGGGKETAPAKRDE